MSLKNAGGTIGNRTRHLMICSAVPQPTAPPGGPTIKMYRIIYFDLFCMGVKLMLRTYGGMFKIRGAEEDIRA